MSSEAVEDAVDDDAPEAEDGPEPKEATAGGDEVAKTETTSTSHSQHKANEVKIVEADPSQFTEGKSEHAGEYIQHAKSGSKTHLTPSKMGTPASKTRVGSASSKAGLSASKMQVSPSKSALSPSKIQLSPSKEKQPRTSIKQEVGFPAIEITEVDTVPSPSKDQLGVPPSRRGSRMQSLTSEERLRAMASDEGGAGRRRHSERRSSPRPHGTLTGSIISFRRASGEVERAKIPRMQNTYRMDSKRPFNSDCVNIILREVLNKECETERYDASKSPRFAMALTSEIRARIKLQHFDRYKIIVFVSVCEKQQQSMNSMMRFLWDPERDNYTTYSYENPTMFVVACAFGVYYE